MAEVNRPADGVTRIRGNWMPTCQARLSDVLSPVRLYRGGALGSSLDPTKPTSWIRSWPSAGIEAGNPMPAVFLVFAGEGSVGWITATIVPILFQTVCLRDRSEPAGRLPRFRSIVEARRSSVRLLLGRHYRATKFWTQVQALLIQKHDPRAMADKGYTP